MKPAGGIWPLVNRHGVWLRPLATLVFMLVLATVFSPERNGRLIFWQWSNLSNVFRQISDTGILAMAMTLVIISGGIDLSVGALLALSSTVFAYCFSEWSGWWAPYAAMATAVAATSAFGCLNGVIIARLRIQPFIVTLAAMIASRGFARWLVKNSTISIGFDDKTRAVVEFVAQKTFVISALAAVGVLTLVLLNFTRFGRYLFAIGGAEETARLSGLPVGWVKTGVYTLSGGLAGVVGILYACETHQGSPNVGVAYELDAIAAAVLGGTSLAGGRGGITGAFVGALSLGILSNILGLNNVDENIQWMIKGCVIVFAVWLQRVRA